MRALRVWMLAVVGLLLTLFSCQVQAQRSLECQMVWQGPSSENDVLTCLKNSDRLKSQWKYYVFPGFAALVFLVVLIGLPIIMIFRCCGCCASCMQPHKSISRAQSRCWLFMCVIIAILWACGVCVLIIGGANIIAQSANRVLDNVESGPVAYINDTKNSIEDLIVDKSGNVPKPDIDLSAFNTAINDVDSDVKDVRNNYFKYFRLAQIVADCIGAVGVVLMFFILLFACCRCSGCCSAAFSALYFFFALIFSLLAILFAVVMYGTAAACGEVTLHYQRLPGIMQWYVVPLCEDRFNFAEAHKQVDEQVTKAANLACEKLLEYCDNNDDYSIETDSKRVFRCGEGITVSGDCNTLEKVSSVLKSTYVKPMLSNTLCVNTEGWKYMEKCTLQECSKRCVDLQKPNLQAKTWSMQVMAESEYVLNVSEALSMLRPLLGCNYIVDKIATVVETENTALNGIDMLDKSTECSSLHTSSVMLAVGFFVGALMFVMGFYVLQRGSWIWSKTQEERDEDNKHDNKH